MHVKRITNLCTVKDIKEAINNLSSKLHEAYRDIILDILAKYPGDKDHALLKKMFIWLCQANYCLQLPEFVAMVTMNTKNGRINREAIPMKAEAFCRRLGPLLNLDRHVHPPEVNLSHATIEQYLQSDVLRDDPNPDLRKLYVPPLDAQKFLAEECLRFLQIDDFRTPLSETGGVGKNPFKGLHGGLGVSKGSKGYEWVERMSKRLQPPHGYFGLEYASINWPEHIRKAGYTTGEFHKHVLPILDDWFKTGDPRYQNWQEVHAYFCSSSACPCREFQEPESFLQTFQLLNLYQHAHARVEVPGGNKLESTSDDASVDLPKLRSRCPPRTHPHSVSVGVLVPERSTEPEVGAGWEVKTRNKPTDTADTVAKVPLKERSGKKLGKEPRQEQIRFAQEDARRRRAEQVARKSKVVEGFREVHGRRERRSTAEVTTGILDLPLLLILLRVAVSSMVNFILELTKQRLPEGDERITWTCISCLWLYTAKGFLANSACTQRLRGAGRSMF